MDLCIGLVEFIFLTVWQEAIATAVLDPMLLLLRYLKTIGIKEVEKRIQELDIKEGLTVYYASYLVVAKKSSLILVTDDCQLERVARKYVKIMKTRQITQ